MSASALVESVPVVRLARAATRDDQAIDAEQSVLGALLINPSAIRRINGLRPQDFADDAHRQIFSAILDEHEGGAVDLATVGERLRRNGADDHLVAYVAGLALNVPTVANLHRYAELVREKAERRALAALGAEIQERAERGDVGDLQRDIAARLRSVRASPHADAIDWNTLAAQEPPVRRWAVRGWLGFGHTSLLVGPGGIGKTLLAQQLASCLALSHPFVDEIEAPVRTLFWACEDDHDELWRRQVSIARWLKAGLDAFAENLVIVPRHGLENALIVAELGRVMFTPLIETLREQAADLGAEAVILDNAAQLFGASENDRHAVTMFLNALAGALPGKAVLLLAHPARAAGSEFSGSSAWENVARTRLYLGTKLPDDKADPDEQPADDVRYLARRKANYSSKDWRRFTFRDGVLVPDEVEAQGGIVGHIREQAAEEAVLAALTRLQGMGIDATEGTRSPRFLPRLMHEYKLTDGHARTELAGAMRRLMVAGTLVRKQVGKYENRSPMFGLRAAQEAHK